LYDRGIRRRLTTMLHNPAELKLAYSLLFSLPGTPVMRYGDEIGMGDDLNLQERISVRTPMQWSDEKNAGFTNALKPFRPVISKGEYSYHKINVAREKKEPASFLNWTIAMIKLRKDCPEFSFGKYEIINSGAPHVLAIRYTYQGKSVITLHNFSAKAAQATVSVPEKSLTDLTANQHINPKNGKIVVSLKGYGYKWYRLN